MHRRRALTVVPLIVSLLAAGCGSATTQKPTSAFTHSTRAGEAAYRTPPKPARPALAKVDESGMLPADTVRLASPLSEFGLALLSQEAQANPTGNIVLSPVSIQDALVMTLNGARGETAAQMQKALGLGSLSLHQVDQSWADLIAYTQDKTDAQIRIANSLWLRHGVTFEPTFLATDRDYFAGDAAVLPSDPQTAAAQINDWVDKRTGGRITQLVGPISPDTQLVLVNATYVKAGWHYFKTADTRPGPFALADGQRAQVSMMQARLSTDVTQTPAYLALPLTANGQVTVTVVLPKAGQTPESILPLLAHGGLAALRDDTNSQPYIVNLSLPRVRTSFTDDSLGTILQGLGMTRAFNPFEAQFGGITSGPLWISQVVHEATLDLNEQGVEAAAGSAVLMAGAAPPTKELTVNVDRPFVVVLSEGESGAPLFMAIVRDPR